MSFNQTPKKVLEAFKECLRVRKSTKLRMLRPSFRSTKVLDAIEYYIRRVDWCAEFYYNHYHLVKKARDSLHATWSRLRDHIDFNTMLPFPHFKGGLAQYAQALRHTYFIPVYNASLEIEKEMRRTNSTVRELGLGWFKMDWLDNNYFHDAFALLVNDNQYFTRSTIDIGSKEEPEKVKVHWFGARKTIFKSHTHNAWQRSNKVFDYTPRLGKEDDSAKLNGTVSTWDDDPYHIEWPDSPLNINLELNEKKAADRLRKKLQ
jgi:hypothetical protein